MADSNLYIDRHGNKVSSIELMKGKNKSEEKALQYFYGINIGGCFSSKYVTDEEYLALVLEQVGSLESRKLQALKKLGLDEDQVQEIPPVGFQGYTLLTDVNGIKHEYVRITKKGIILTATKELTWLFFGEEQIFVYKVRIDMVDHALKSEKTKEYFYKDVTAFSTESESHREKVPVFKKGCGGSTTVEYIQKPVESEKFVIVVPGESFETAISPEDDNESKISAMKQKLREKKNNS